MNADLYFDYTEEELAVWFDDLSLPGVLRVGLRDREDFEQEDDN